MFIVFCQVTTVNLDNQHLGKLANMEQLENLRWASFNNNDLTKIEVREHKINSVTVCSYVCSYNKLIVLAISCIVGRHETKDVQIKDLAT